MSNRGDIIRQPRRCGHCGQVGHDRRTCPAPEQVERRRQNRVIREQQQRLRIERRNQLIRQQQQQRPNIPPRSLLKNYTIINENSYPIYLYWIRQGGSRIRLLQYLENSSSTGIKALPIHKLICIPVNELGTDVSTIECLPYTDLHTKYFVAGEFNLTNHEDLQVHVIADYKPSKTELEQWKECGLKSLFLLKELDRLGATKNENLEPIMDMIQDIQLPPHTELDKELAGVPSSLTNIT